MFVLGGKFASLWLCVCLLCVFGSASTQEHDPVFITVKEGRDVLLPCSLSNKQDLETKLFDWRKVAEDGEPRKEVFMYDAGAHYNNNLPGQDKQYKGRVSHFQDELRKGNASILIKNTILADSGNYTCDFPRLQPSQIFSIRLTVVPILKPRPDIPGASPKPVFKFVPTKEGDLLQCEVKAASPEPVVEWRDSNGTVLQSDRPEVTEKEDGRFDVVSTLKVTKTGHYSCVSTQKEIGHQVSSETFVLVKAAAPRPYITTLNATEYGSVLQCEVPGSSPKPVVEWRSSDGTVLQSDRPEVTEKEDGRFDVILKTTVTKTGQYRCVSTQEEIGQVSSEAFVLVKAAPPRPYITTLKATEYGSVLQCEVPETSPKPVVEWRSSDGTVLQSEEQVIKTEGRFKVISTTTVTKTGHYRCVVTQKEINHQVSSETFVFFKGAAQEPHIKTLDATDTKAELQCAVKGASSEPKVEWMDSEGTVLQSDRPEVTEKDGRFDVILKTTVTKSGHYSCVVTQKEIYHQTSSETFVPLCDKVPEDGSWKVHLERLGWIIVGASLVVVGQAVAWLVPTLGKIITTCFNGDGPQEEDDLKTKPSSDEGVPLKERWCKGAPSNC